jgi:HK97 family phage portal protein
LVSIADIVRDTQAAALDTFKARLTQMLFPSMPNWTYPGLGGTRINYSKKVDAKGASIIASVINWTRLNFAEAPLIVEKLGRGDNPDEIDTEHPLTELIRKPNPFYSGSLLWSATIPDYIGGGNAFWIISPNSPRFGNKPVELWYVPAHTMNPVWPKNDNSVYISHYEYTVDNETLDIPPENVVHFRLGIDPNNTRMGLSPLGSLFREIFTDNEAANWTAALLANGAVPGLVISPEGEKDVITQEQAEAMKVLAKQKFGGDRRGEAMVTSRRVRVTQAAFNPQQMNLRDVRRIPEERATAVFGIPAVVVGLGAGLDRSTFANMAEAREAAYESFLIPHKGLLADQLQTQLLPRFSDPRKFRVGWDYSKVKVLQEDEDKKHIRAREDFKAMLCSLDEARELVGLPRLPQNRGKVYLVPMSFTVTPEDELVTEVEEVPEALAEAQEPLALPPGRELDEPDLPEDEEIEEEGRETPGKASMPAVAPLARSRSRKRKET